MTTTTNPIETLWARASGCLQAFELLFAPARALMDSRFLKLSEARAARAFLRGLEALVRRLLLARAQALLAHLVLPRPTPRRPRKRAPTPDIYDLPEDPALWPAPFRHRLALLLRPANIPQPALNIPRRAPCHIGCALKAALGRRAPCAPACPNLKPGHKFAPPPVPSFTSAAPTALRLEALARVIDDPAPYALRMARLIARRPATNQRLTLAPPPPVRREHIPFLMIALKQAHQLPFTPLARPPRYPS